MLLTEHLLHSAAIGLGQGESRGEGDLATMKRPQPGLRATRARREGLGVAWGLINGIIFTLGLWCALTGLVLLLLR